MIRLLWRTILVASWILPLAGCFSGPPMKLYVLGDPAAPANGVWSETGLPVVVLKITSIPDYLDSTDILRRTGSNEVTPSPTGQWGERLSVGLTRALAAALSKRLPQVVIVTDSAAKPSRRVFVEVKTIDIGVEGHCLLSAAWRITGEASRDISESGRGTFRETIASADDPAIASAMTGLIDQLADQIVKATAFQ